MSLSAVTITPLGASLAGGLRNARAAWSGRRGLLLQLLDSSDAMGQGEASPLPGYSPDTGADCEQVLAALDWGSLTEEFLAAPDAPSLARLLSQVPEQVPAARFALESALLDLLGERHPSWQLLGLPGPPTGAAVPRSQLLSAATPQERIDEGRAALALGVVGLKVKLGVDEDFEAEFAGLVALRRELGEDFELRLDANQGWEVEEAVRHLQALAPLRPAWIEEPVPWTQLHQLGTSPVPVALDESLQDPAARRALGELAGEGLVQAIVLKPTVLGGVSACLDLAATARGLGLGVAVTHTFEGPVGYAATVRLARLLTDPAPCGLAPHEGLGMCPLAEPRLCWSP